MGSGPPGRAAGRAVLSSPMTTGSDVVVIGGGAIGGAIACFLAGDPSFDGRVTVVERDPTYREASSALSAGSIRQQFSTPENIRMSRFSFDWLADAARHLAVPGEPGEPVSVGLREAGYLYLAGSDGEAALRANHAVQRAEGADVVLLGRDALAERFPWLGLQGVALGALGLSGEGWFDGYALVRAMRRKAAALGAQLVTGEAVRIEVSAKRAGAVVLADGRRLRCGTVIDAAGPWAREVAQMAGLELPVAARRRPVFAFAASTPPLDCPLVIDPSGAWFRPEGDGFIGAPPPPADEEDRDALPLVAERGEFEERLWPILAGRVPAFDTLRLVGSWAGYYELNTFDHNAILGPHPEVPNVLFANGFSGHGLQQAPAVGRAIAELVAHGRYVTLDLSVFGYERIAAGRRVVERNIIG